MSRAFVEIPADILRVAFTKAGFTLIRHHGHEEVYARHHHIDPRYMIKVYSTIPKAGFVARSCGKDAIRVVATFGGGDLARGIYKTKRVHRMNSAEATIERMLGRMREAYAFINDELRGSRKAVSS